MAAETVEITQQANTGMIPSAPFPLPTNLDNTPNKTPIHDKVTNTAREVFI
jgi:hypothetical protein